MLVELASSIENAQVLLYEKRADIAVYELPRKSTPLKDGRTLPREQYSFLLMVIDEELCDAFCEVLMAEQRPMPDPYTFGIPAQFTIRTVLNCARKAVPDAETRNAWIDGVVPYMCRDLDSRFPRLGNGFVFYHDPCHRSSGGLFLVAEHRGLEHTLDRSRKLVRIHSVTMQYELFCPHGFQRTTKRLRSRWRNILNYIEYYLKSRGLQPLKRTIS